MKAVILHGSIGHPFENWFPWLGRRLSEKGWSVRAPQFPTPEGQNRENWMYELTQQAGHFIDKETVIIGHSCGGLLLLNCLNEANRPIAGSVFVGTPFGPSNIEEFAKLDKTFFEEEFNWGHIRKRAGRCAVFHGTDDPYVPLEQAHKLAKKLEIPPFIIENGGHLNTKAGYDDFPQLYEWLKTTFPA